MIRFNKKYGEFKMNTKQTNLFEVAHQIDITLYNRLTDTRLNGVYFNDYVFEGN